MKNEQRKNVDQEENLNNQSGKQSSDTNSDPENKRTRKPGIQSNSSKQSNNGRGGGK
jgi:hypothetical protein